MQAPQRATSAISRARRDRLQRFATLRPLIARTSKKFGSATAAASLAALASALKTYPDRCRIQIALRGPEALRTWWVHVELGAAAVVTDAAGRPDLRLTMDDSVWLDIARGKLAPLAAFVTGRLRITGDCALAKSLYRHLARPGAELSDIDLY